MHPCPNTGRYLSGDMIHAANYVNNVNADALRSAHNQLSPEPHPLLSEDLLKLKHPMQKDEQGSPIGNGPAPPQTKEESPPVETVDSIGSLSVAESGRTKFYGNSANSYVRVPPSIMRDAHLTNSALHFVVLFACMRLYLLRLLNLSRCCLE
jgi:hypothetical protein